MQGKQDSVPETGVINSWAQTVTEAPNPIKDEVGGHFSVGVSRWELDKDLYHRRSEEDWTFLGTMIPIEECVFSWGIPAREAAFIDKDCQVTEQRKVPGDQPEMGPPIC